MSDPSPMRRGTTDLAARSYGLAFAVVAALVLVAVLGLAPVVIAVGLLALLAVD